MAKKLSSQARIGRSLVSALISVALCGALLLAAFIFTCGMKSLDGPQGASNEGPVMLIMMLVSIYFPVLFYFQLAKVPGELSDFGHYNDGDFISTIYKMVAGLTCALAFAVYTGLHLHAVQWGSGLMVLDGCSIWCGALTALAVCLTIVHSRLPTLLK